MTYRFCNPAILHFGEPEREYQAARSEAVLFDVSDRAQIEVTGKDARKFLNNFCTNDIHRLGNGQGCEAFVTNAKGRILAHIFVFVTDDSIWLETNRHVEEALESGFPLFGLDLTSDNLAQEAARTQLAISYNKGCYLGQEPIARIDALGHVNRELRILCLNSTPAPDAGTVIRAENGREIGVITSSALVPGEGRSVALGYVRSSHAESETAVIVCADDPEILAKVLWHEQSIPNR